jgi:hypothetical protein
VSHVSVLVSWPEVLRADVPVKAAVFPDLVHDVREDAADAGVRRGRGRWGLDAVVSSADDGPERAHGASK